MEVIDGTLIKRMMFKVSRKDEVIATELKAGSLKIHKENAKEVKKGMECGIMLDEFEELKEGDILTSYEVKDLPKLFKNERVEIEDFEVKDK